MPRLSRRATRRDVSPDIADAFSVVGRDYLGVTNYSVAHVLPGRHVISFVPVGWPLEGVSDDHARADPERSSPLTAREREVLALAADGLNAPRSRGRWC